MSTVSDDPTQGSVTTPTTGPPVTMPVLPIVQLSEADPRLQVYYSLQPAYEARQESPYDVFFDVRGFRLAPGEFEPGSPSLVAGGDAAPNELQGRVVGELRRAADLAYPDGIEEDPIRPVLDWLEASPSVQGTIDALGLAPREYPVMYSYPCTTCTKLQKLAGKSGCCP